MRENTILDYSKKTNYRGYKKFVFSRPCFNKFQFNMDYLPQIKPEDECLCCKPSMKVDILDG